MSDAEPDIDSGEESEQDSSKPRASAFVAAGILLSRISGLIREGVFSHFFGTSMFADAFRAALRMPNALQNLLGEGTLSASFIPVYSELLEEGRKEDAGRLAGAIFSLLFVIAAGLVLIGILLAPLLVSVFTPGFSGERREVTITLVRILFPMTGFLVLYAWTLGILNSHRKFFLSYVAPVLWNGAIIAAMLIFGARFEQDALVIAVGWGAFLGGVIQFAIQLPWVFRLEKNLIFRFARGMKERAEVIRNAIPAILGRGVVQISGYLDMILASLLAVGGVAAIAYAQTIYMLPVGLFGMSVAAAELPELSRQRKQGNQVLRQRANEALRHMSFYVIPSLFGFLALGDVIVGALYERGEFGRPQTILVAATLAAYGIALTATTATRLYNSTYFALRDTKTPAKMAALRVAIAAGVGFFLMVQFEEVALFGWSVGPGLFADLAITDAPQPVFFGAVGLAMGSGIAAWIEWFLLRRNLAKRIGKLGADTGSLLRITGAAVVATAAAWGLRVAIPVFHPIPYAIVILGAFVVVYFPLSAALGIKEGRDWISRGKSGIARITGRGH